MNLNNKLSLNFVGDINFGEMLESYKRGVKSKIIYKDINPFEFCVDEFKKCDLNTANLEFVLSDISNKEKPFSEIMRVSKEFVSILKNNHINIVNLANNHTLDHGEDAFNEMVDILKKNDILFFGLPKGKLQREPLIVEKKGIRLGFWGYYIEETKSEKEVSQMIKYIKNAINSFQVNVEKTVLSLHWGHEYTCFPRIWQVKLAKDLIDECNPDIIYGHHSHRLNGIVEYRNCIFAPSLGNFVFDDIIRKNRMSAILRVDINTTTYRQKYKLIPFFINKNFQPVKKPKLTKRISKLSRLLEFLMTAGSDIAIKFDKKAKKMSRNGHILNRIKIRILFIIFLFNYRPYVAKIIKNSFSRKRL